MNKPSHRLSRKPTAPIRKARNPSKINEKSRNSATVQDSPNVFPTIPSTPLRTYSTRSPAPYTRYEKGTRFPTDREIRNTGRGTTRRSRDKAHLEMLSRRRSEASSKPSPGGVFYGPAEVQMGFSRELRKGEGKPGAARREEGFVHTRRGCLMPLEETEIRCKIHGLFRCLREVAKLI